MINDLNFVKYQQLKELQLLKGLHVEPELGCRICWKGQVHTVIIVKGEDLLVADEWIGFRKEEDLIRIQDWKNDSSCAYIPSIEELLEWIYTNSGNHPSMSPGVCHCKSAWQVKHAGGSVTMADDLNEALLDLLISLLSPKENSGE